MTQKMYGDDQWTDTGKEDGKICNNDAKKHPVVAELTKETIVSKDFFDFV